MKRITQQNYYELLDISPQASTQEVRWAYDQAMNIYSADSVPTYSLLPEKERDLILSRLVDAYKTLTNGQLRAEYNQALLESGELIPEQLGLSSLEQSDTINGKLRDVKVESLLSGEETGESQELPAGDSFDLLDIDSAVSGKDIQAMRIAKEISVEDINRKTNIPKKTLEDIEEERFEELPALVYLKGFLKTYARILHVNEHQMVDGYVKRLREWKASCQR
ncbi:MAG: helix-turn-helix domain-containing protein [Deltaproteobacteria bacterium]|nr:helix-turn-helix domain-containing protein [Deltaproteobacteria bacterium]